MNLFLNKLALSHLEDTLPKDNTGETGTRTEILIMHYVQVSLRSQARSAPPTAAMHHCAAMLHVALDAAYTTLQGAAQP